MDDDRNGQYEKLFSSLSVEAPEPPAGLERKIMRRISRLERRLLIAKTAGFGVIFAGFVSLLVYGYFNMAAALAQSGFLNIASLLFSDFSSALANFQDFAFSMLESFPVFSAAFLVAAVIGTVWSAAHFIDDVSQVRGMRGQAI